MRDHRHGQQWDSRHLRELHWCRIRVTCGACRNTAYFRPDELAWHRLSKRGSWRLLVPKFRCTACGQRRAEARVETLPRD